MGNDLGQAIKINRLRANMTQADLASGIISVSYLSKIENGTAEPPTEILEMLGERLKIISVESEERISDQTVIRWFYHLLLSKKDESIRLYNKIKNNLSDVIDKQLLSLIEIHKLHYYVMIQDLDEAENLMFSLQKSSKRFNETEKYYLNKFSGNFYYTRMSYQKALKCYQDAENHKKAKLYHQSEEVNNLYYLIASAASKIRQTHLSLLYSIKALEYYQTNYDLQMCAECHILQGISYQRINDIEKAKKSYYYSVKIAEDINDIVLLRIGYQNLGSLCTDTKQSLEAINYYLKSYELRKEEVIEMKIIPISSLMKEYYSLSDLPKARIWLELGLDLIKSLTPIKSIHVYELQVYRYLIEGVDPSFESFLINEVIPFLEKKELHFERAFYLKLLANYYKENRKYKLSSYYYEKACSTLTRILERR